MPPSAAVPAHVRLILDAANTLDVDEATDAWSTPADLARWLREHTGAPASARVSSYQHDAAVRLRDSLRKVIAERGDPDFGSSAKPFPLRVGFEAGTPTLVPQAEGAIAGVAQILAAVIRTAHEGDWDRVKICPADSCQVAFFDESRNRSRAWCSMKVCGNRTKTRAYRARHPQA